MNEDTGGKARIILEGPYGSYELELDKYEIDTDVYQNYPTRKIKTIVHATTEKDMKYTSKSVLAQATQRANCQCSPTKLPYKNDCKICERNDAFGEEKPVELHPMRLFNAQNQNYLCLKHYAEHAAYLKKLGLICSDKSSDEDDDD